MSGRCTVLPWPSGAAGFQGAIVKPGQQIGGEGTQAFFLRVQGRQSPGEVFKVKMVGKFFGFAAVL